MNSEQVPLRGGAQELTNNKRLLCCYNSQHETGVWGLVLKIVVNILVLGFLGLLLLFLDLYGVPLQRGYFEVDTSIRYPFVYESISPLLLFGVASFVVSNTIIAIEFFKGRSALAGSAKKFGRCKIPAWIWKSNITLGVLIFGGLCQQLIVTLGKYWLGRLRPHFYDVCRPVASEHFQNNLGYITDYRCTGPLAAEHLTEARLSMPSAHSSFAMYCAVFFVLYVQENGPRLSPTLLKHLAQFTVILGAWYVGLSRIIENKHHWSDVTVGFAIGAIVAVLTYVCILKPQTKEEKSVLPMDSQTARAGVDLAMGRLSRNQEA